MDTRTKKRNASKNKNNDNNENGNENENENENENDTEAVKRQRANGPIPGLDDGDDNEELGHIWAEHPQPPQPLQPSQPSQPSQPPQPPEIPLEQRPEVMELMERFALVLMNNRVVVVEKDFRNPDTGDIEPKIISLSAFREYYSIDFTGKNIDIKKFVALLPRYEGMVFRPRDDNVSSKLLNLWRGFA